MSKRAKCKLNSDGSVCLQDILDSFNSLIKEEHAWALCYQLTKYFIECLATNRQECRIVSEVHHVYLQTDGNVHKNTIFINDATRKHIISDQELITGLGFVIYNALDQGNNNGEERVISQDLEQLINDMILDEKNTTAEPYHETDDEGIERDSEEGEEAGLKTTPQITFNQIIHRCERHLGTLSKTQAESHYKAVVRAFVTEALELATFLEKVAQGTSSLRLSTNSTTNSDLDQLQFADWARFWVQVINELRMGVKLKKVHYSKAPIEYELTPYEILMKDIRSCRYNLRKIMVNGDVPSRVTKDAHAIILEFIRSRPPLKKVSERKLAPYSRTLTPREQLMNSIKKGRKLKPTVQRMSLSPNTEHKVMSTKTIDKSGKSARRLIKLDTSQLEDDEDDQSEGSPLSAEPGLWPHEEYQQLCDNSTLAAYDLATPCPNTRYTLRRNTLEVHEIDPHIGSQSVPQSRPCSRQSCNSSEAESFPLEPEVARALQEKLTNSSNWHENMTLDNRLSLTLEEIVHIRSVLTKAELEALPAEGHVKSDVENRKVCFLCLKTRFGIFGPWGQRCTLCKRTVCSKCCSKMNIPMEHFSGVPVVLLSPSIMCTPEDELKDGFPRSVVNKIIESESTSAKPSRDPSPDVSRPGSSMESEPSPIVRFRNKAAAVSKAANAVDRMKGSQMMVCHDCKMMVLQIIKSARVSRSAVRNKTLQNLTLNLSPVF